MSHEANKVAKRGGYTIWVPGSTEYPALNARKLTWLPWHSSGGVASRLPVGAAACKGADPMAVTGYPKQSAYAASISQKSSVSPQPPFEDTMSDAHLRELMNQPSNRSLPIVSLLRRQPRVLPSLTPEPRRSNELDQPAARQGASSPPPAGQPSADLDAQRVTLATRDFRRHFHDGPVAVLRARATLEATDDAAAAAEAARTNQQGTVATNAKPAVLTPMAAKSAAALAAKARSGVANAAGFHISPSVVLLPPWPTRHADPKLSLHVTPPADLLFVVCRCRRPVGDVALCSHSDLHLHVRRMARHIQATIDSEAAEWATICTAAHTAATKYINAVNEKRIAAAPLAPIPAASAHSTLAEPSTGAKRRVSNNTTVVGLPSDGASDGTHSPSRATPVMQQRRASQRRGSTTSGVSADPFDQRAPSPQSESRRGGGSRRTDRSDEDGATLSRGTSGAHGGPEEPRWTVL